MYSGKFQNNSTFTSGERLGFIESLDAKLIKIKDLVAADVIFLKGGTCS